MPNPLTLMDHAESGGKTFSTSRHSSLLATDRTILEFELPADERWNEIPANSYGERLCRLADLQELYRDAPDEGSRREVSLAFKHALARDWRGYLKLSDRTDCDCLECSN